MFSIAYLPTHSAFAAKITAEQRLAQNISAPEDIKIVSTVKTTLNKVQLLKVKKALSEKSAVASLLNWQEATTYSFNLADLKLISIPLKQHSAEKQIMFVVLDGQNNIRFENTKILGIESFDPQEKVQFSGEINFYDINLEILLNAEFHQGQLFRSDSPDQLNADYLACFNECFLSKLIKICGALIVACAMDPTICAFALACIIPVYLYCTIYCFNPDPDGDGYTVAQGDCDNQDPNVNPGMSEIPYNGKDDDCNKETPDDDLDGDGYNWVDDCNDNDIFINPGVKEECDLIDNNCDGDIDGKTAGIQTGVDDDGDNYCDATLGGNDCNDFDKDVNPGKTEVPNNEKDDDCNPNTPDVVIDKDNDGYNDTVDCNDNDANINPGKTEIPYNGKDDDCNVETRDDDLDGDGYIQAEDCNDNDKDVNPGKTEIPYNGKDDDCNSSTLDDDLDADTYIQAEDCNDNDAAVNPGQTEVPYNGKDDDCNSSTLDDDLDADTYIQAEDCNDNDAAVNPGMTEIPGNGKDDDCNSSTPD
jgi:hypothetical protein